MRILFTGGGSGGHFYPIIAIAQEINQIIKEESLLGAELIYMSDSPYDERSLFENGITFRKINAGKIRRYRSVLNFFDYFKTIWGIIRATLGVFLLYPDV